MIVLLNLAVMAIFLTVVSLSMVMWAGAFARLYNGQPILAAEPRIVPPLGVGELLLGFGVMVLVSTLLAPVMLPAEKPAATAPQVESDREDVAEDAAKVQEIDLDRLIGMIVLNSIATGLAALAVLLWLRLQGVSFSAAGFIPTPRHLAIGFAGAIMILPPVMLLQAILASQIAYEHPLLEVLKEKIPLRVMIAMAISSSIVAPLVEEFYFRGLMQGWLEKISVKFGSNKSSRAEIMGFPSVTSNEDLASIQLENNVRPEEACHSAAMMPEIKRAFWPGLLTSAMFALVHAGQGPAPFSLFFLALGIAYLYTKTGSIWPGIVVHFVLNATTTSVMILTSLLAAPA